MTKKEEKKTAWLGCAVSHVDVSFKPLTPDCAAAASAPQPEKPS